MLQNLSSVMLEYLSSIQSNLQQGNISNFFWSRISSHICVTASVERQKVFWSLHSAWAKPSLHSLPMNATEFVRIVWFPVQEDIDSALCNLPTEQTKLLITAQDEWRQLLRMSFLAYVRSMCWSVTRRKKKGKKEEERWAEKVGE